MNDRLAHYDFEIANADVFCFNNGTEVKEYQVMIHVSTYRLPFAKQLEAVMNAYNQLLETKLK